MISIVMPFKNVERFIEDTLISIQQQTIENWELIAIDDHSIDSSNEIVKQFQKNDGRIVLLKNEGNGIIPALKTAEKHIRGDYVTRMDADDIMLPNKIEEMKNLCSKNTVAIGKVRYFMASGKPLGKGYKSYEKWLNRLADKGICFNEIYKECPIPSPSWMMKSSTFLNIGGFNSYTYPEDYELAFRMYENGLTVRATEGIVHLWRDYPERTSRTHKHYSDNNFFKLKVEQFLRLDFEKNNTLTLIGAGKKGKKVAQELLEKKVLFNWQTNNPNKVGHYIYGVKLQEYKAEFQLTGQVIVAVSAPKDLLFIQRHESPFSAYYYFC